MQKRLQIQEIVGISEKSAWSMEDIIKSVHSWVLDMPWSFVFMSPCLFPQSLSCYLPPVTSFVVVLWVRFLSMCCGQLWHIWGWSNDIWVVCLFCPVSFSVVGETWECVLWQWTRNTRRLPYIGSFHLPLVISGTWAREIKSVRRNLWDQRFSATMGAGGRWAQTPWIKKTK